jgi:hypothetical protein
MSNLPLNFKINRQTTWLQFTAHFEERTSVILMLPIGFSSSKSVNKIWFIINLVSYTSNVSTNSAAFKSTQSIK